MLAGPRTPRSNGEARPSASLEIALLGHARILAGGSPLDLGPFTAALPLLTYLLLHRRQSLPRRHVASMLWPDAPEAEALAHLRRQIYLLGQTLPRAPRGRPWILADRVSIQWRRATDAWLDVAAFEAGCAVPALDDVVSPNASMDALERALAIYTGDLLCDFFDDWIQVERERLRHLRSDALRRLIAGRVAEGSIHDAADAARTLVEHDPLCEESHRLQIGLLYLAGDRGAALEAAAVCRTAMADGLNVEPMASTVALETEIRAAMAAAVVWERIRPDLPTGTDLSACLRVAAPNNLRPAIGPMIGREAEMASLIEHLTNGRLVTIVGSGGSGKSRLARAVADTLLRGHPPLAPSSPIGSAGLWWVDLAPLTEAGLVPQAIASAMGLTGQPGLPMLELVERQLGQRQVLLVLDNAEQVLDGCASTADHLLRADAALRVLTTSQERLGLAAEIVMPLAGLSSPESSRRASADAVLAYEAPRLFVDRARRADPGFRLRDTEAAALVDLCRGLGGLPLAIELAASHVRDLPIARIGEALLHMAPGEAGASRHRQGESVLGMIEWSHARLAVPEQLLLRRLGAFLGSFTVEDAVAVAAGEDIDAAYMPLLLNSLSAKSLLVTGASDRWRWYRMLQPIRHYARADLSRAGELEAVGERHFQHFLALAETADDALRGPDQPTWLSRLDLSKGNLRAAFDWAGSRTDRAAGELRLATALRWYWYVRGQLDEGRQRLARALDRAPSVTPALRARALNACGTLAWRQGDFAAARADYEASLGCSRRAGDTRAEGLALGNLGMLALSQGKLGPAQRHLERSVAALEACGDRRGVANGLGNLGLVHHHRGNLHEARALGERCMRLQRLLGDRRAEAVAHLNLGRIEHSLESDRAARRHFEQARRVLAEIGDRGGEADVLNDLGNHAAWHGAYDEARRHLQSSLKTYRELGLSSGVAASLGHLGQLARLEGDVARAQVLLERSLAIAETIGAEGGIAMAMTLLAELAADRGQLRRATRLAGAAWMLREREGLRLQGLEQRDHERCLASLRAKLGQATFDADWCLGQSLTVAQAAHLARADAVEA